MAYRGEFKDIFYPNDQKEARVARYRLVLVEREQAVCAVVHLRRETPGQPYQPVREREFDTVVGRIVDLELRGVRGDRTRLLVEAEGTFTDYPLDFNAGEIPARPSSTEPWKRPVVEIELRDIVGGSIALFVDIDAGQPAEAWLEEVLRG